MSPAPFLRPDNRVVLARHDHSVHGPSAGWQRAANEEWPTLGAPEVDVPPVARAVGPRLPGLVPGYYAAVGSAVSDDGGESWKKLGPVVTSARPKAWQALSLIHI